MIVMQVLLAEYGDLRSEIHQRVNNQLLVIGGNIALLAAVLPAYDILADKAPVSFLVLPLLFSFVAWLYFEQDLFLTEAATYLHRELRPQVERELHGETPGRHPVAVMQWERFRGEILFTRRRERRLLTITFAFRYLATMGPGVGGLALGLSELSWGSRTLAVQIVSVVLIAVDVVLIAFLVFLARLVVRLYEEISR